MNNNINIECKYYLGYKPCIFHKKDGRSCANCIDFQAIEFRILIVKLDALGDVLRTTSIIPALTRKFPHSSITWITKINAIELLINNPSIDRILKFDGTHIQYILNEKFNIGICLDADPQSAAILSLANCEEKYGFKCNDQGRVVPANIEAEEWYYLGLNDEFKKRNRKTYQTHIYEICKLDADVSRPQLYLTDVALKFATEFYKKHNLSKYKKILGINTGGGNRWEMKKWINSYYTELVRLIKKEYPEIAIMLFGGPDEMEFNNQILSQIPELIIDTGCKNSLSRFSAMINLTDMFLTADSLGMHISIALNKTTFVLVGPTSPWELNIFGNGDIIYNNKLDCIACYNKTCYKKNNCMNTLKPEYVLNRLKKYL